LCRYPQRGAQIAGLEVNMKNDVLLQKCVAERLERDHGLNPELIGVEVHHGVVKLAGFLRSEAAREEARRAAQRVEGVLNVVLDITIRPDLTPHKAVSTPMAA
jgi:osmotically-inducible protein OsmY